MSSPDQYRATRQTPQSAASILARHGAAQRALTAKQLRDDRTNELRQCVADGNTVGLGWRHG